jgi:predicted MFS family arabinose efflux permease
VHEALDQSGALVGPLVVAAVLAGTGSYRTSFAMLAIPGALAIATVFYLRAKVPRPSDYNPDVVVTQTRPVSTRGFSRTYWLYAIFTAFTLAGFATFAVLAYHLQHRHVVSAATIPVMYAVAMGVAALASLASGAVYDRVGLRGLVVVPVLGLVVPFWSFSTSPALVWAGAIVWGAAMGVLESTLRAAVADLVPRERRGVGYGTFTAVYGVAWLAGAALIGVLYDVSVDSAITFTVAMQVAAGLLFVPLTRSQDSAAAVR